MSKSITASILSRKVTPCLVLVLTLVLVGCGSSSSTPNGNSDNTGSGGDKPAPAPVVASVSCTLNDGRICTEFAEDVLQPQQKKDLQADCEGRSGSYTTAACPQPNHVGTCALTSEGIPVKIRIYEPITIDLAQQSCIDQGGVFQSNY